jgi:hypothetical protein
MSDLTLADVDGTIPGKAGSLMRNDSDEELHPDPITSCWNMWRATKSDWPKHTATVVANPRASYLRWKIGMQEDLGITNSTTPQDYIDIMNKRG